MPLSRSRDYLSIGELLEAVREDFPDVSISKIRFLETEGLLAPQRTESGYRKFYPSDVERLRQILALQRDRFLPLKVIKTKIENGEIVASEEQVAGSQTAPTPSASGEIAGVQMDRAELLRASGLAELELASLEDFGVIAMREGHFDENDLAVARSAKRFFAHGVEPRHLRMYLQFAEREASVFSQIVGPVARKKDPTSVAEARTTVQQLQELARAMHAAMLRASLRSLT